MTKENESRRKRPIWVWIVSIFFFLSAGWTLWSFYLINTGTIPLGPAQEAYFDSLTTTDYTLTIAIGVANLIGAVALFLLRKVALYFFLTALGANLILAAWHGATKGWAEALGGSGLVGALFGYVLLFAACIYAWKLAKRGTLR